MTNSNILNIDDLLSEAVDNIRDDRKEAKSLLKDLTAYVGGGQDRHKESALSLAKYIESCQKSNEQLLKIAVILKKTQEENSSITEEERNSIFEELNTAVRKPEKLNKEKKNVK